MSGLTPLYCTGRRASPSPMRKASERWRASQWIGSAVTGPATRMGREACWRAANCCWTSGTVRKYTVLAVVPDNSRYAIAATITVTPIATFTWCGDMPSPPCASRLLAPGLGIDHHMCMPPPQIASYRDSREEIANEDRRPRERMQHGLCEHHGSPYKTSCREDKEKQHAKAEIGIVLGQCQERRSQGTRQRERQPVEHGEGAHNPQRELEVCRWHKQHVPPFEQCHTEHIGCIERVASQHVEEPEPEGNGRRTTGASYHPFLGQCEPCRRASLWRSCNDLSQLAYHSALLSRCFTFCSDEVLLDPETILQHQALDLTTRRG